MARTFQGEFDLGSNTFFRPNYLEKAGDKLEGHAHNFDHVTWCIRGSIRIEATLPDGSKREVIKSAAGAWQDRVVNIRAGVVHTITALEDDTEFVCVYSHRSPQGESVQKFEGFYGALT